MILRSEHKQIPVVLINLDRRLDRLGIMKKRLQDVRFHRISAVDGAAIDGSKGKELVQFNLESNLSKSEIACILSHRLAWEWIIENQSPVACIIEDDVYLSPDFPRFIKNSDWLPNSFDLVKIETMLHRVWLSRKKTSALDRALCELRSTHAGSAGYIASLHGARRLLEISLIPDRPVDDMIFECNNKKMVHAMLAFQLVPALCVQDWLIADDATTSDIDTGRKLIEIKPDVNWKTKLWREFKRPFQQLAAILGRRHSKTLVVKYR